MAGYLQTPPLILTTLGALPAFERGFAARTRLRRSASSVSGSAVCMEADAIGSTKRRISLPRSNTRPGSTLI